MAFSRRFVSVCDVFASLFFREFSAVPDKETKSATICRFLLYFFQKKNYIKYIYLYIRSMETKNRRADTGCFKISIIFAIASPI